MTQHIERAVYAPFWLGLLQHLNKKEDNPKGIAKEMDVTFSYVSAMLKEFTRRRLVRGEKKGRKRYYTLTPRGLELAAHADALISYVRRSSP